MRNGSRLRQPSCISMQLHPSCVISGKLLHLLCASVSSSITWKYLSHGVVVKIELVNPCEMLRTPTVHTHLDGIAINIVIMWMADRASLPPPLHTPTFLVRQTDYSCYCPWMFQALCFITMISFPPIIYHDSHFSCENPGAQRG